MKRCTTLLVHFFTCHFSTVQTTCNLYLDTLSTCTHSVCNCHLDSATISNHVLNLTRNILTNDSSIKFRLFNLEDVDLNIFLVKLLQLFLQLIYILTTFTNDNTWTGCTNSNGNKFQCTFDNNTRNACFSKTLVKILTDFLILNEVITEVLTTEPI